ncbi:MAG: 30S ribosomal protein S9 [Candidatus Diapherotrites archaeon]|nr:30S ribosomal protein S9 [Candidatus Diapherotrites archaeon]
MAARKSKAKIIQSKAKRKTAVARARIKKGSGSIKVNAKPLEAYGNEFSRNEIGVALSVGENVLGKNFADTLDIDVNVRGGGFMGQAEATKTAIAKALVAWTESEDLKSAYLELDRHLLVDDVRRKESKKPLGRGARKKRQKSYR